MGQQVENKIFKLCIRVKSYLIMRKAGLLKWLEKQIDLMELLI